MRSKQLGLLFVALSMFTLGGCATNPSTGAPTVDTAQITDIENRVQQTAAAVCGFVPTLGTVASIVATFSGGGPIISTVNGIANAICKAVAPPQASAARAGGRRFGAYEPKVNGVPVKGYFIR